MKKAAKRSILKAKLKPGKDNGKLNLKISPEIKKYNPEIKASVEPAIAKALPIILAILTFFPKQTEITAPASSTIKEEKNNI
jgi:hypothetical protein